MENVPLIDLAEDKDKNVAVLDFALRQFGFFYVTHHGIPQVLIDEQFKLAQDIFALPYDLKASMPFDPYLDIGYVGSGVQSLDPDGNVQQSGDTKEQFMMTNNKIMMANNGDEEEQVDPEDIFAGSKNYSPNVADHAKISKEYAAATYRLNMRLNELLFDAIDLTRNERENLGSNPFVVLKQMRYRADPSDPSQGKFGAGAHTDWGSFTILATDKQPGLQIQMGEDSWLPVPPKENCLIINSGDQISQLTNDVYRSAMHRVVISRDSTHPRFSTAIFTYFNMRAQVAPLQKFVSETRPARYPYGRTTNEYFHFKLSESMGKRTGT